MGTTGAPQAPPINQQTLEVSPAHDVPRRQVLKTIAVGGATAVVAGTGALSYRVFDTAVLDPGAGRAYDPWQHWQDDPGPMGAVAGAILAANPHNTQPWIFHVTANSIDVLADTARAVEALDPFRREQRVGLGCAVENLALACRARRLDPVIALLPDGPDADRVAHVSLLAAKRQPSPLYDAIGRRHTNRGPYDGKPVSAEQLAALVDTRGLHGVAVHWVSDPAPKAALDRLLVDAAVALTRNQQQSRDSFAWFRANNDAVRRHRDGLTLDAQGMSPLMLSITKLLPASSRAAGDAFWVDQTRNVHTKTAAAYGILTADDPYDPATQLVAGRLLQRIHLTATDRGVALQHMNQITEGIDRELTTAAPATFGPRFSELLPRGAQPLVTFRVGYPSRAARPSPRRALPAVTR
jgi:hypothetical protein